MKRKKTLKIYDIGIPWHMYCVYRIKATSFHEAIKIYKRGAIESKNCTEEDQTPCKPGARKIKLMDIYPIKKE